MKNKQVEALRLAAKRHHSAHHAGHFANGVRSYHCYDHRSEHDLSWRDDCSFVLNDYRVHLSWMHPRMVFQNRIDEEANKRVAHLYVPRWDIGEGTPIHKRVGKSRKKIAFREWQSIDNDTWWYTSFEQTFAEIIQTEDVSVVPYLKAKWTNRSRFVELCVPIEVRNEDDLVILANLAKRLLKRETSLNDEFPGYVYRRSDWEQDTAASENSTRAVAVHRLA